MDSRKRSLPLRSFVSLNLDYEKIYPQTFHNTLYYNFYTRLQKENGRRKKTIETFHFASIFK